MICPGCNGKRWVDSQHKGPTKCPVCNGEGSVEDKKSEKSGYDQDSIWRNMVSGAPQPFAQTLTAEIEEILKLDPIPQPLPLIVHLLFDFPITPQGNLIYDQLRQATLSGHSPVERLNRDQLIARGYVPEDDGKVKAVDGIPVGPFYLQLTHWGQDRYKVWVMQEPIEVDVNRKGNPFFMDGDMVAFKATYSTGGDDKETVARRIRTSLEDLRLSIAEKGKEIINLKLVQLVDGN